MRNGLTLLECLVILAVVVLLAALFLPALGGAIGCRNRIHCAANLGQLHLLGQVYSAQRNGRWPSETGEALWLALRKSVPPLEEEEMSFIFYCPVKAGEAELGKTDYQGPSQDANLLAPGDLLGADKRGNHGPNEPLYFLRKSGDVREASSEDWAGIEWTGILSP